ncbi:MAG: ISL3 family transposase [Corynebacterium sp.]|uniref:ISL3 family transposase n=3 Tax=Corynebacterium casei TaxID=160386 RepID=UPI003FD65FE4
MHSTGNIIADTICRTAELGLAITGASDAGEFTLIEANATAYSDRCPDCDNTGAFRDHVHRRLVDLPVVGFPTQLRVRLPRDRCTTPNCRVKYYQSQLACAVPGKKVTHRVTRWILQRLAIDRMSISATAKAHGIGWDLTCQLALDMCRELIYNDPTHLDGVHVIGVDEHKWSHNRAKHGAGYVTVIVDMTSRHRDSASPARLLDVVEGRSADALRMSLARRSPAFRHQVRIVAMDGFQGYATASKELLPTARRVMDPFHVVRLAGDKLTACRQRLQREKYHRRGLRDDPLYKNRKTLLTTQQWLSDKQQARLDELWAYDKDYAVLKIAWHAYQGIIDCYRMRNKREAKKKIRLIINELRTLKGPNKELAQLGRSLHKRLSDVLAFFDVGVSNGPVEAINGRLEHLRGIALGFRNLNHYTLRSLIHSGQLTHKINAL